MSVPVRDKIRFLLNGAVVSLSDVAADTTLLDYLRLEKTLRGTKEGCAEGDCGACTVLVGRLVQKQLVYESVNACIRFVGSLDGCHVVTIEHLQGANGELHPVQKAMVEHHGSQCGYCTPGFVMSLYGLWMQSPNPDDQEIEYALQGNLCRCTGYAPIIRAAKDISTYDTPSNDLLVKERATVIDQLEALADGSRVEIGVGKERLIVPASVDDFADVLAAHPGGTIVAGSTDVGLWVTKFMRDISPAIFIGNLEGLQHITEEADGLTIGAGVSYTDAFPMIEKHFSQLSAYWARIGGQQVRNMGTIGGNIANGSPIGDTPPPLIALGARVTLRRGAEQRSLLLEDFFIDYGKQDRQPDEFVESIFMPFVPEGDQFAVYKISKRLDEDISAVCGAFKFTISNGVVSDAVIAFGGMAATPKRAKATEAALIGQAWGEAALEIAVSAMAKDYTPISDMRASADYRLLAAQNLLRRFYLQSQGEVVQLERGVA